MITGDIRHIRIQEAYTSFGTYILGIDHVQGDPFAAPSRLHVQVAGRAVRIPKELYDSKHKKTAVAGLSAAKFCRAAWNGIRFRHMVPEKAELFR